MTQTAHVFEGEGSKTNRRVKRADGPVLLPVPLEVVKAVSTVAQQ